VRLVLPVSENTPKPVWRVLERIFGAPLLLEYGCVEIGAMAYTCPAGTLHISHEHVILEVIDEEGSPVAPGQVGRVVLTPYLSKTMPLVRYELGDLAILNSDPCPCGRYPGLPALKSLEGRSFDRMLDGDGRWWHAFILYYAFKEVFDPMVFRQLQGVQVMPGAITILIVPGPSFDPTRADYLARAVEAKVGGPLKARWELVNEMPREKSGKLKYFRSELEPETARSS
jgi:phenylacetate-CoA ligase